MLQCQFASDNATGVHPKVLEMLTLANAGAAIAYGDDEWTAKAVERFHSLFGPDIDVLLVPLGTGANTLSLRAMARSWQCILCSETAHIRNTESASVEAIVGVKLTALPTVAGKIKAEDIPRFTSPVISQHQPQPRILSLTQSTERGTVYSVAELKEICGTASAHGLLVQMDGTRIANAAVSLGCELRTITRDVGVDVLTFGGTKNGLMCAEAVIFFNRALSEGALTLRKQCCQLYSKMRYIAAQYLAYFEDDLWRENARNANAMARYLAESLRDVPGVSIAFPVEANGVFAQMSQKHIARVRERYYFGETAGIARWVCSFNTTKEDVDTFVDFIRRTAG